MVTKIVKIVMRVSFFRKVQQLYKSIKVFFTKFFSTVNFNEECSSLRSSLNTSILEFFGHKTKPSCIKRLIFFQLTYIELMENVSIIVKGNLVPTAVPTTVET